MQLGPLGNIAAGAAGAPLAQTKGAELDRTHQESASHQRRVQTEQQAADAAGIGQTDGQDHQTDERDADGRLPWEIPNRPAQNPQEESSPPAGRTPDPNGQIGAQLDLLG
ncbi:MAG TPA: hypothetical protein PK777_11415 [Thermoguttaceae bacterium]|nr:hypothetical protein [Thermoguttaceae bacterium]HPP53552.1 hypothetical protein [Thermoguttaceae bacterium]